ncbi:MAG: DoxX family protein [Ginsengibacter sp.]
MSKLLSTKYSTGAFNLGMLVLRLGIGVLLASHGFDKLTHFNTIQPHFMNFMGIGQTVSVCLAIFAEFFCSIFLILGLFTRLSCVPVLILMSVILVRVMHGNVFGDGQLPALFFAATLTLLFCGPGQISIDGMIKK